MNEPVRKILVSGASGLIGSELVPMLERAGYAVTRLVRSKEQAGREAVFWNPAEDEIDAERCEDFDAVVHLAAESMNQNRLAGERKWKAIDSRVRGTMLLASTMAKRERRPRVFVLNCAVGFYGERGDETITEASARGRGFLADLCHDWERATEPAAEAGIRVVRLRTGVALTRRGGALREMLPFFRAGLGGWLGNGRQWFPWIAMADHVRAIQHVLETESLTGPVNSVAPEPRRQKEFSRMLGRVMSRPALFPVPKIALQLRFGHELGDATLWSQRVVPEKLVRSGFDFRFPDLESALRHEVSG